MVDHEKAGAELLTRARAGDRDAFASIWRIYQPQMLRFLHARGTSAPDDVASLVWLEIDRALGHFEGDGDAFRQLLFTIARRRAIDQERKVQRRSEVPSDSVQVDPSSPAAEASFEARDSLDRALTMIRQLKPATAEAVMLRVVYQLPVAEVAAITGRSEANVRTLVHRGLSRLRSVVGASADIALDRSPHHA